MFSISGALAEIPEFANLPREIVYRSIGIVLKNAVDWDGHRGARKKNPVTNNTITFNNNTLSGGSLEYDNSIKITKEGELSFANL